jgi:hypothetical protein
MTLAILAGAAIVAGCVIFVPDAFHRPPPRSILAGRTSSVAPSASTTGALPPVTPGATVVQAIDKPESLPSGYTRETVGAVAAGTTAGFTIGIPARWHPDQIARQQTRLTAPDGVSYMEIDLTKPTKSDMVAEAEYIRGQSLAKGDFPGYQQPSLQPEPIRGTLGAFWRFDWVNPKTGLKMRVDDLMFTLQTKDGPQSYTIFMTAPAGPDDREWNTETLPIVTGMLHTFNPFPA